MLLPEFLRAEEGAVLLSVKLQPRASKNEIGDPTGAGLKVRVTAPPVDDAANEALIELLADKLRCAPSRLEIVRGRKSRHKSIRLHGFTAEQVLQMFFRQK